ncbi:hypothetical protein Ancab_013096 [Ancistrocladus abbreviatus]
MPCLPIPKKLLPSKKDWCKWKKSATHSLRSKLHISKAIIHTTTTRLTGFRPFSGHHHPRSFTSSYVNYSHHYNPHRQHHRRTQETKKSASVYVDMLFSEKQVSKADQMGASTSSSGNSTNEKGKDLGIIISGREAWKAYVSSMPPIRGIDERAEEFISKFRQQMRLQREQSILDFQEMLARSA